MAHIDEAPQQAAAAAPKQGREKRLPARDRITVILYDATAPGLQPGAAVPVTFTAGGFTKAYQGKMTAVSQESSVAE